MAADTADQHSTQWHAFSVADCTPSRRSVLSLLLVVLLLFEDAHESKGEVVDDDAEVDEELDSVKYSEKISVCW